MSSCSRRKAKTVPEVVVVGAGLAGLACARHLSRAGVSVTVLEAEDAVGGRVRTDIVDGMLLDRGFQVHNTGYPEAQRVLDHAALDLQDFAAGALVRIGDRLHKVGDPLRVPTWAPGTALAPIGSLKDKVLIGRLAAGAALHSADTLLARPEMTTYDALRARGLSDTVIDRFFRPFLSGIFLEAALATSSRLFDLIWRSFARGTQCVPAAGMGAIPAQLAGGLDVRLSTPVEAVAAGEVRAAGETLQPRAVVVATAAPAAGRLLPGVDVPPGHSVTTHYHLAPEPPIREKAIALDGEGGGPVANSVVVTNAAPSYAPGRQLVASSVVAGDASEPAVRAHLSRLYGVDTSRWEAVAAYTIIDALPSQAPPMCRFRKAVRLEPGLYVCGDHRDSASIQGALVSGRRAATAVLEEIR
ncbi:MAG: FAD-dependent oxidoreductase [Actinobacteria bacterium]|nr:FAD-dependent oxidoreductase [Actinomycetota bacterium]